MRFTLIDRITDIQPGKTISAVKNVTLTEEYLQDHFPLFPVLPGVFMLEAATQTAAWLIRVSEDFAHSMVLLREARNVKYGAFVAPGHSLTITVEMTKQDERESKFKFLGTVDGETTVSGRLVLERFNLSDTDPADASIDQYVRDSQRELYSLLSPAGVRG